MMHIKKYVLAVLLIVPFTVLAQQPVMPPELAALDATMTAAAGLSPESAFPAAVPEADATAQQPEAAVPEADAPAPEPEVTEPDVTANSPELAADASAASDSTATVTEPTTITAQVAGEASEFTPLPVSASTDDIGSVESAGEDLITITLDDVEMIDVVRMFSRIANANIIATPSNLTTRVTANLDGVAWRPALSSILKMHNLALVETPLGSGVYSITPQAADAPEPLIVETIFLDYTTVDEVFPVIEKMLVSNGSVSTFASRNAMVIRSTERNLGEIKLVVKDIDIQSQQVCIETQFMELTDSAVKQLGIRWDSLEQLGVGLQAGPFVQKDNKEHVTSRADTLNRADRRSDLDRLNQRYDMYGNPYQGEEAVVITERVDGPPIETVNLDSGTTAIMPTRQITRAVDLTQDATSDIADTFTRTITESSAAILSVDSLNVVLSALKKTDGVSVVSNPKIIVANGATNAFFRVGAREPIIKTTTERGTVDSPGDTTTSSLDTETSTDFIRDGYLSTGIELRVVPTVKVDNLIEAQIEPSLRRKTGDKEVDGNSWPIISVKEIKTKFTLQSGQTVAIGGLTDTTDSKQTSKIPLLGDIPIIGKYLFSHTKDVKSQIETIIFVSLTLVDPKALTDDQGIPYRAELVHKAQIKAEVRKREMNEEIRLLRKAADDLEAQDAKRSQPKSK